MKNLELKIIAGVLTFQTLYVIWRDLRHEQEAMERHNEAMDFNSESLLSVEQHNSEMQKLVERNVRCNEQVAESTIAANEAAKSHWIEATAAMIRRSDEGGV